jgi:hypothetical protein
MTTVWIMLKNRTTKVEVANGVADVEDLKVAIKQKV